MSSWEDVAVWSTVAVNGDGVTMTVQGQVVLLFTGDLEEGVPIDDHWFARRVSGYPVEMTRTQLLALRAQIDQALEVVIDEHAPYRWQPKPESPSAGGE